MNKFGKRVLSIALVASVAAVGLGGAGIAGISNVNANAAEGSYELADNIQDGTILHCFDWKYTDIKDELENIAKAGFTSIQTSPAQASEGQGAWYWLYQPLGFSVGTNELGTKEELKELCDEAEKYGINIIVDVVANHLASNHENIQEDLKPDEYWHDDGAVISYNDRYQVTHGDIGMPDLNSENEYVQQVVANYVSELKEIGVDGIRWDAAKHIGLPSEECDFWTAVTKEGLYNYGEILSGPVDNGGEDLMAEYTEYMSVTDSSYGASLLNSFNSGNAPSKSGNWSTRGVAANKLVYWGESHDTYSNAEGEESNGVAQNIVDRAYAVAAARNGSSALYLSRPEATARDSIRSGVKGSMHFTSDEIAAINHFHNAMIGKEDYYTVSNNCSVITRKDGGAVIVCGSGSGEVTVENGGKFAKTGTYRDEITGNEFVVTEDTITGVVGESGIAVIYESNFTSRVSASPEDGTTFADKLEVTLNAIDVTDAKYETSEGASGTFENGDVIVIGEASEGGAEITVTLTATTSNGTETVSSYKYTKEFSREYPTVSKGGIVFDNSQTNWKTVNIYVYDEVTFKNTIVNNAEWPGVVMTEAGDSFFTYQLPEKFADCEHIMVIFNNGSGDQIPGAMQAGQTMNYTDDKFYDGTKWIDYTLGTIIDNPKEESEVSEVSEASETSEVSEVSEVSIVTSQTSEETSQESKDDVSKNENSETSENSTNNSNSTVSTVVINNSTGNNTGNNNSGSAGSISNNTTNNATNNTSNTSGSNTGKGDSSSVSTSDNTIFTAAFAAIAALISGAVVLGASKKKKAQ